jgi:hypothetical protein
MNSKASKRPKNTQPNRSVYAIATPYREDLLAKEERLVVSGTVRPGSRRGLPPAGGPTPHTAER